MTDKKIGEYLVQKLEDLLAIKVEFENSIEQYKDNADKIEDPEAFNFRIMLLNTDLKTVATEVACIHSMCVKLGIEIPEEYSEIEKKEESGFRSIPITDIYTFAVDKGKVEEKEKGIVEAKLKLTKNSDTYLKIKSLVAREQGENTD